MSHFAVLVIGAHPESQLEPFDENLELEMHQVATQDALIDKVKRQIANYQNTPYAEYLQDPEGYEERNKQFASHINYLKNIFPKRLKWNRKHCYDYAVSDYRDAIKNGESWCEIHEDGSLWKTTNENAKWDWYRRGGRWRGKRKLKTPNPDAPLYSGWECKGEDGEDKDYDRLKAEGYCDQALAKDVTNLGELKFFAILKDGEWYEKGEMGWFAIVSNEKAAETWETEQKKLLADLPGDTLLTVIDCHI